MALLPDRMLNRLRVAAARQHIVTAVGSLDALRRAVHERAGCLAIIDPGLIAEPGELDDRRRRTIDGVVSLRHGASAANVLLYLSQTSRDLPLLLPLVERGYPYVIEAVDDQPAALLDRIARVAMLPIQVAFFALVSEGLSRLAPNPRAAIESLMRAPEEFPSPGDVQRASRVTRRTLDRALERAALPRLHDLLVAARYVHAYALARFHDYSFKQVAAHLGMPQQAALTRLIRAVTDLSPTEWRVSASDTTVATDLKRWLSRRTRAATAKRSS